MSELEQVSGGLGFAELKEKAEGGDKDALQVMRNYIVKKEEVVEFIENKEVPITWECDIEVLDKVMFWKPGAGHHGKICPVIDIEANGNLIKIRTGVNGVAEPWILKKDLIKVQKTEEMSVGDIVYNFDVKSIFGLKLLQKYQIDPNDFDIQGVLDKGVRKDFEKHELKTAKILRVFFNSSLPDKLLALVHFDFNTVTGGSLSFACSYDIEKLKKAIKK
ncbi:hypothetical protein HN858_00550, partial [Candidatus Falkowbacteria bacterium]|nr:hypothetical protein [Candidatus Falkowbacteria bacterium]